MKYHEAMWPGADVSRDLLESTRTKRKHDGSNTAAWFGRASYPTSVFFSHLAWAFAHPKRFEADRSQAATVLNGLITRLLASVGEIKLDHFKIGDNSSVTLVIDSRGLLMNGSDVWIYRPPEVSRNWALDLSKTTVTWITTPISRPHISDLVCFFLDPNNSRRGLGPMELESLHSAGFHLLAQLAVSIDRNSSQLASGVKHISSRAVKNADAVSTRANYRSIAEAMWFGDESSDAYIVICFNSGQESGNRVFKPQR
jgi:hypothetical protein